MDSNIRTGRRVARVVSTDRSSSVRPKRNCANCREAGTRTGAPATSAVRQPPGLSESACWTVALQAAAVPRGMSLRRRNLIVPVRLCRHSSHKRPAFELTVHTLVKTWRRQKASGTTVWRTNLPRNVNELASRHLMPGQSSPADPKARNHQATRIRLRSSSQLAADLSTLLRIL